MHSPASCNFKNLAECGLRWLTCLFCLLAGWLADFITCWWLPGLSGYLRCLMNSPINGERADGLASTQPLHVNVRRKRRGRKLTEGLCLTTHQSLEHHGAERGPTCRDTKHTHKNTQEKKGSD